MGLDKMNHGSDYLLLRPLYGEVWFRRRSWTAIEHGINAVCPHTPFLVCLGQVKTQPGETTPYADLLSYMVRRRK